MTYAASIQAAQIDLHGQAASPAPSTLHRRHVPYDSRHSLLWIDDDASTTDPLVLLLGLEGIGVRCAQTGGEGLDLARAEPFMGLVLDLNLPDMSGLAVLQTLRDENIRLPTLVLTGFGDTGSALIAGRLGVLDFRHKPILEEDWTESVRNLIRANPGYPVEKSRSSTGRTPLRDLHEAANANGTELVTIVARILPGLAHDVAAFVAGAEVFRLVVRGKECRPPAVLAEELERRARRLTAALERAEQSKAAAAPHWIDVAMAQHTRPSVSEVAQRLGLNADVFESDLQAETGRSFYEWRSAMAVMRGVRLLAESRERVSQIAYSLGYNHPSQFDREFHRMLYVSPRRFRSLLV